MTNFLTWDLIKPRLLSFGWSLLSLCGTALIGVLVSPDFAHVVTANFGDGATSALILLAVTELVKHLRNIRVLNVAAARFGSRENARDYITLI